MANDTITHNEMTEIWFLGYVIQSHEFMGDVQEGYYFRPINARSGDVYGGKTQREAYEACKQYAAQQSVQRIGGDAPLEDSPFETGIRRGVVVLPPANR